jgi:hypothetical protein
MADKPQVRRTVFFKDNKDGETVSVPVEMFSIDAHNAVTNHPKEYSYEPWDGSEGPNLSNGEPRAIVPNDWVDLKPSDRIALARQLGAKDVRSGAAADEFINGYLIDRANAGASPEPAKVEEQVKTPSPPAPSPLGPPENNPKG